MSFNILYIVYKCAAASAAAKSLQLCPTLCDPIDGSPPGSPVPEILQARTLEWVAISFSNAWKWKVKVKSLSRVRLLVTPWTAAYQAPPSMGFSRQEYWSGVPLPSLIYKCDHIIFIFLWFISFSIMSLRFIHVVAYNRISFFYNAEKYSIVCINHILRIHSFVNRHIGCFDLLVIIILQWT